MRFTLFLGFIGVLTLASGASSVTVQDAEKQPLKGYVLTTDQGQVVPKSGVRVGPLDLGFEKNLDKYQLPQTTVQKLQPYIGKTGDEAKQLIEKQPLTVTQEEYDQVGNKFLEYWQRMYERAPRQLRSNPRVQTLIQLAGQKKWPQFLATVDQIRAEFAN